MLTIYIGDTGESIAVNQIDTEFRRMPSEIVNFFWTWYRPADIQAVNVYTPTLVNLIGELIEDGRFDKDLVKVVAPHKDGFSTHEYASDGTLIDWPYGIFNYS